MTVNEYRKKHPKCEYCAHRYAGLSWCYAVGKKTNKRRAKKCPCYKPKYFYERGAK